ncbi:MBL fold metallo-hydrolase [Arthrobacter sp. JSM 101049]|uniref:MBL fold metallo-hydrolase n=1 Tax=Arthrobacter sp. JSM 101049 TaxID=929097 RepID=UPI003567F9CA
MRHDDEQGPGTWLPTELSRRTTLTGLGGMAAAGLAMAAGGVAAHAAFPADGRRHGKRSRAELVLLGTQAGPPPVGDRAGISSALVVEGRTYVVDCGRAAVSQYMRAGLSLDSLESIFITHLHADHVADYYNFLLLGGHIPNPEGDTISGPINIYGPGPAGGLPEKHGGGTAPVISPESPTPGTRELTERMHEGFAYSHNIFLRDMSIRDVRDLAQISEIKVPEHSASYRNTAPAMEPFVVMEDERVKVTAVLVPHGPVFPSFAFRFDTDYGSVTFSGDTAKSHNLVRLARGTDILVHEAVSVENADLPEADLEHMLQSHVRVQEVGSVAVAAGARHLVLSHISDLAEHPIDERKWSSWAKRGYRRRVTIGSDLQRFPLSRR